jgi:hypothetical protein
MLVKNMNDAGRFDLAVSQIFGKRLIFVGIALDAG